MWLVRDVDVDPRGDVSSGQRHTHIWISENSRGWGFVISEMAFGATGLSEHI